MNEAERLDEMERLLERLVEESEEACNARQSVLDAALAAKQTPFMSTPVPSWLWTLLLSLAIQIAGALYVTGQFNGKFEEFRTAVYQRLDRLERMNDSERHRAPDNYVSPPVTRPR